MELNPKYKDKIIKLVSALMPDVKIYLFGSRARQIHHERSDIDIALDGETRLDVADVGEIREILNALHIPYKVDVVDFHHVSNDMREMILKEGVLWKS